MHDFEFEQWPNVTRFKKWKTSFRREVGTSSTHPRQASRLVGRDRPGEVNARFGRRRICIRQRQDEFSNPWIPTLRKVSGLS